MSVKTFGKTLRLTLGGALMGTLIGTSAAGIGAMVTDSIGNRGEADNIHYAVRDNIGKILSAGAGIGGCTMGAAAGISTYHEIKESEKRNQQSPEYQITYNI